MNDEGHDCDAEAQARKKISTLLKICIIFIFMDFLLNFGIIEGRGGGMTTVEFDGSVGFLRKDAEKNYIFMR